MDAGFQTPKNPNVSVEHLCNVVVVSPLWMPMQAEVVFYVFVKMPEWEKKENLEMILGLWGRENVEGIEGGFCSCIFLRETCSESAAAFFS